MRSVGYRRPVPEVEPVLQILLCGHSEEARPVDHTVRDVVQLVSERLDVDVEPVPRVVGDFLAQSPHGIEREVGLTALEPDPLQEAVASCGQAHTPELGQGVLTPLDELLGDPLLHEAATLFAANEAGRSRQHLRELSGLRSHVVVVRGSQDLGDRRGPFRVLDRLLYG